MIKAVNPSVAKTILLALLRDLQQVLSNCIMVVPLCFMLSQIFSNLVHTDITVMVNWKIWLLWPVNHDRVKCQDDMFAKLLEGSQFCFLN